MGLETIPAWKSVVSTRPSRLSPVPGLGDRGDEGVGLRRLGVGELEVAARALREVVAARQVELVGLVVRRQRDRREAREPGVPPMMFRPFD